MTSRTLRLMGRFALERSWVCLVCSGCPFKFTVRAVAVLVAQEGETAPVRMGSMIESVCGNLRTSVLGFGCGSVMGRVGRGVARDG